MSLRLPDARTGKRERSAARSSLRRVREAARIRAVAGELPREGSVVDAKALGEELLARLLVAGDPARDGCARRDALGRTQLDRLVDLQLVAGTARPQLDEARPHVEEVRELPHPRE